MRMKAIIKPNVGLGLDIVERPIPEIEPHEVLIRVKAASICGSDIPIMNWDDPWVMSTVRPGQIIGHEFCGEVVKVGSNVTTIYVGSLVTAEGHIYCGVCYHCQTGAAHVCPNQRTLGYDYPGAFAEYIKVPASNVIGLGDLPIRIAAIQDPFGNAVHATSKANLLNRTVVIAGCGPIGLMCISLAKLSGAYKIIASDPIEYRLDLAEKLGAHHCINPSESVFEDEILAQTQETRGVDIFFEMSGNPEAIRAGFKATRPGGKAVLLGLPKQPLLFDFANDLITKGITVEGVIGREVFRTWHEAHRLLADPNSQLIKNLELIITHILTFEEYELGFDLMQKGLCGKVLLVPSKDDLDGLHAIN
jgi:threonine 3-dehydrogenase